MINAKLIIYDCNDIYKILYELNDILKYDLIKIDKKADLESHIKSLNIFLIISKKKVLNEKNELILDKLPIKINSLISKINIYFLKNNFNLKSNISIGKYLLDNNSRKIYFDNKNDILELLSSNKNISTWWTNIDNVKNRKKILKKFADCFDYKDLDRIKKII